MSDRFRISRRRVMQLGITAPLAAMQARGATAQDLESAAMTLARVEFPPQKLIDFKRDAQAHCDKAEKKKTCEGFDAQAYGLIVLGLWAHFADAVIRNKATLPAEDSADLKTLVQSAYDATSANGKSGEIVAERTKEWGEIWFHVTNYCAYRCGIYAAEKATIGKEITPAIYAEAFKKVSEEIKIFVLRITSQTGQPVEHRGGGC